MKLWWEVERVFASIMETVFIMAIEIHTSGGHNYNNFFKLQFNINFRSMKITGQTRALFFL